MCVYFILRLATSSQQKKLCISETCISTQVTLVQPVAGVTYSTNQPLHHPRMNLCLLSCHIVSQEMIRFHYICAKIHFSVGFKNVLIVTLLRLSTRSFRQSGTSGFTLILKYTSNTARWTLKGRLLISFTFLLVFIL